MAEDKQASMNPGMDDYVSKPIDFQKITTTLEEVYRKMSAAG